MTRVLVVPQGCGIGDFVNLQPLVRAIARARPGACIDVLGPPTLAMLLPQGVSVLPRVAGIPYWQRSQSRIGSGLATRFVTARTVGPPARLLPMPAVTRFLSWYLEHSWYLRHTGYDEVINLLHDLVALDPWDRWTAGSWNRQTVHVVDALADSLATRGIDVREEARVPRLPLPHFVDVRRFDVLLNVNAGNTLKGVPYGVWHSLVQRLTLAGLRVGLIKGPHPMQTAQIEGPTNGVQVVETPTLRDLMRALAAARCVVSPDTGVLHMAAAMDLPFVGLFGPTDWRFLGPYSLRRGVIVEASAPHERVCRGCWAVQLLPVAGCGMGYPGGCMASHNPDVIENAVHAVLERHA